MINMGHVRFENTTAAMDECIEALYNDGLSEMSESERCYAEKLYERAKEYIEKYENEKKL